MNKYRAGELDQQVDIHYKTKTVDDGGGVSEAWSALACDVWAKVVPLSGNESLAYSKLNAIALYRFVFRYRSDLDETQKIVWDGDDYNIRFIPSRGSRPLFVEVIAERGVTI